MKLTLNIFLILITLFLINGCSIHSQIEKDFKTIVFENGINEFEATTIAKMRILHTEYRSYLEDFPPTTRQDQNAQKYPEYWFIDFSPEILFDAPSYLVVINRKDGVILLDMEYWPNKNPELDWVFERTKKNK